jgi:hypothetical protein
MKQNDNSTVRVLITIIVTIVAIVFIRQRIAAWNSPNRDIRVRHVSAQTIETTCVRLVDSNGTFRGTLDASQPGRTRLSLQSDEGDARIELWAIDGEGVKISLNNEAGASRQSRGMFFEARHSGEVRLDIRRESYPGFSFFADTNTWAFSAGTAGQGYSQLSLRPTSDGHARLRMRDKDGKTVWQAPEKTMK